MARNVKRGSRCWYAKIISTDRTKLMSKNFVGPAHAVYFATYEIVKNAMGGNEKTEHHPLAAGKPLPRSKFSKLSD